MGPSRGPKARRHVSGPGLTRRRWRGRGARSVLISPNHHTRRLRLSTPTWGYATPEYPAEWSLVSGGVAGVVLQHVTDQAGAGAGLDLELGHGSVQRMLDGGVGHFLAQLLCEGVGDLLDG